MSKMMIIANAVTSIIKLVGAVIWLIVLFVWYTLITALIALKRCLLPRGRMIEVPPAGRGKGSVPSVSARR